MTYRMHLVRFSSIILWRIPTSLWLAELLCPAWIGLTAVTSPTTNLYTLYTLQCYYGWNGGLCVQKKNADVSIQSIAVVRWHENNVSSVACQPLAFRFSYPTLWPQNMCLRPPGLTSKHWIRWQTRRRPLPGGPPGPAGRSTCYNWRCSSAWCCPSSSVPQPCCSVWCSHGRCTGSAVCY